MNNKNNAKAVLLSASLLVFGGFSSSSVYAVETIDTSCGVVATSIMPSGDRQHVNNADFSVVIGFDYDTRGYVGSTLIQSK